MKIKKVETFLVPPRSAIVRIRTDEGIVGYGEATVEGRARTQVTLVEELAEMILGEDPTKPEAVFHKLTQGSFYRDGFHFWSGVSAIDQACWDIFGKSVGLPIHTLLGGAVRERIRVYRGVGGETIADCVESAAEAVELGFTALKMGVNGYARGAEGATFIHKSAAFVRAVREAIGDDVDLMVDFHGRYGPATAERLCRELEPLNLIFIEEPCDPSLLEETARIAERVTTPIAIGERCCGRADFRKVLATGAIAIIQPDPCHAGGISEVRKIATMAEAYGILLAPHNPLSAINLAAALHIDAVCPNFLIQESRGLGEELLQEPFRVKEGYLPLPEGPGLGIEVDDKVLESARWKDWRNPIGRLEDGTAVPW